MNHDMSTLPDFREILALEPQELARIFLRILQRAEGDDTFNKRNMANAVEREMSSRQPDNYLDQAVRRQLKIQTHEALAWLEGNLLTVRDPDQSNEGWQCLSRRGRELVEDTDFVSLQVSVRLDKDQLHPAIAEQLHPTIAEDAWRRLCRNDFADAVFSSMKSVEIAVRDATGMTEDFGVSLMRKAFGKGGPLRNPDAKIAEEDAICNLFAGAIGIFKNPHSHRNVPLENPSEAIEIVMFASHLLRILDSRAPTPHDSQSEC